MDDLRVGVVGLGGMGLVHIEGWRSLGVEVLAYDDLPEARAATADQLGADAIVSDRHELLERVDVVDICTPTDVHADAAIAAAEAGRAVVVEKPLARTLQQADAVIGACRDNGVRLFVAHVVRYFQEYAAAKAQIDAGTVGAPAVLRFAREGGAPPLDKWMLDSGRSGGIAADLMIHDIDIARWIAGEVVRVYGSLLRPVGPHQSPTHGYAILTHASGAISHLTASWAAEGVPWRTSFEVAGSAGLVADVLDNERVLRTAPPALAADAGPLLEEPPWTSQLRDFLTALHTGTEPRVTADDGRKALEIALAVNDSAATGKAVEVA